MRTCFITIKHSQRFSELLTKCNTRYQIICVGCARTALRKNLKSSYATGCNVRIRIVNLTRYNLVRLYALWLCILLKIISLGEIFEWYCIYFDDDNLSIFILDAVFIWQRKNSNYSFYNTLPFSFCLDKCQKTDKYFIWKIGLCKPFSIQILNTFIHWMHSFLSTKMGKGPYLSDVHKSSEKYVIEVSPPKLS